MMRLNKCGIGVALIVASALAALVAWPNIDLAVSRLFFENGVGFFWRDEPLFLITTSMVFHAARILAVVLLVGLAVALFKKRNVLGLDGRSWVFLFLALMIGPGLVANIVFKDNWGRARPRDVVEFGGEKSFSAPMVMTNQCYSNCSFVSGDGAFGFFLPSFAYVVSPKKRRRVFVAGIAAACFIGFSRIAIGAHFISDVVFSAVFMLAISAGLYSLLFGKTLVRERWREFLCGHP
ncbi:MAG: phosphatase PAP2 family protein [Alphaproteobacteria bacterium]|nr:phosphatase PAP2 family protein [Alphaproteobacteria bacterium]